MSSPFSGKILVDGAGLATGIDLGQIDEVMPSFNGLLSAMENPGYGPRKQEIIDDNGATLSVTITGSWNGRLGETWADGMHWMKSIYTLIDGHQYDDSESRYLAIYFPNFYKAGRHLWMLRSAPEDGELNDPYNESIHIIVEGFEPHIVAGEQPSISYRSKYRSKGGMVTHEQERSATGLHQTF